MTDLIVEAVDRLTATIDSFNATLTRIKAEEAAEHDAFMASLPDVDYANNVIRMSR